MLEREKNMKHKGFAIAGSILQIIACAIWLYFVLLVKKVLNANDQEIKLMQLAWPVVELICGIITILPNAKKSVFFVATVNNILFVIMQLYNKSYAGLGIFSIVLLLISGILYFFAGILCPAVQKTPKNPYLNR